MSTRNPILLFEPDPALRASLEFALGLEGFDIRCAHEGATVAGAAACLVIDERLQAEDGIAFLARLRKAGWGMPAIILATNPTRAVRDHADAARALLVEKPLLGDALSLALHNLLDKVEAGQ